MRRRALSGWGLSIGVCALLVAPSLAEARQAVRRNTNRHANATRSGANVAKKLSRYSTKAQIAQRFGLNQAKVKGPVTINPLRLTYRSGNNVITTTLVDVDSHAKARSASSHKVYFKIHDYIGRPSARAQIKFHFFGPVVSQKRLVECALDASGANFGVDVYPMGGGKISLSGGEKPVISYVVQPGTAEGWLAIDVKNKKSVKVKACKITPIAS